MIARNLRFSVSSSMPSTSQDRRKYPGGLHTMVWYGEQRDLETKFFIIPWAGEPIGSSAEYSLVLSVMGLAAFSFSFSFAL